MKKMRWMITYISFLRILPAYLIFRINRFREPCRKDLQAWLRYIPELEGRPEFWQLGYLLMMFKESRNVFLNRLHRNPVMYLMVRLLFSPLESCYINMPPEKIGGGFTLQHGFSTVVSAESIGENCRVYQQVTVGYKGTAAPVIGDNVTIAAGAIVIGGIHIGDGACVGAGAVVTHDVQEQTTVVGVPAREIRK